MNNKKIHKIDFIFGLVLLLYRILGGLTDGFLWKDVEYGGFPVICLSVFVSYALRIILLIYSFFKYKEEKDKPKDIIWFVYLLLPFLHIVLILMGVMLSNFIINTFGL